MITTTVTSDPELADLIQTLRQKPFDCCSLLDQMEAFLQRLDAVQLSTETLKAELALIRA